MRLVNELALDVPIAQAWEALLDVPRVARAMPGASVEADAGPDGHRGRMQVRLGPASAEYAGLAVLEEIDDDEHAVTYRVRGREVHGQGEASAVIHVVAVEDGGATRLRVQTDLEISGRQAQLGRGLMEEVAAGVLTAFAERLSDAVSGRAPSSEAVEALDAGRVLLAPVLERAAFALVGLLVGLLAGLAVGRALWRRS